MSDDPKPTSERARKRALGKILREAAIKRRETYFDLLVSGYSIDEIASHTNKSPSAVRRAVAQALANRRLGGPERCPPAGRAADQGAALRRDFARGGECEDDRAVPDGRAEASITGVNLGPARPASSRNLGGESGAASDFLFFRL